MSSCLLNRCLFCFFFRTNQKPYYALSPKTLTFSLCTTAMAAHHEVETEPISQNTPEIYQNYPRPLSPPLPPISRDLEIRRAMEASSRSSLFNLTRDDVLFEDEWLAAVNKPKGVYCEAVLSSVPRVLGDSVESGRVGEVAQSNTTEFHLANRLDRDTSGVMLVTKSHKVASKLVKAFTNHEVRKSYIALCIGSAAKWEKITVRSGHGRSKHGAWRVYAASDVGRALPGGSIVREMETSFEVLSVKGNRSFKKDQENGTVAEQEAELEIDGHKDEVSSDVSRGVPGESIVREIEASFKVLSSVNGKGMSRKQTSGFRNDEASIIVVEREAELDIDGDKDEVLVRAFPRSGRTHQIRLHCQYLGIPIRGDVKYHGVHEWKGRTYDGHELHAESVSFKHPVRDLPINIRAPLPCWVTEHFG